MVHHYPTGFNNDPSEKKQHVSTWLFKEWETIHNI